MRYEVVRTLDLNLLVTLDVLLRERNVTRSAEKLGVSQPAVSAQLARLRAHFDDDLLYRVGRTYELTTLAAQLVTHTGPAVASFRRVFEVSSAYDPGNSDREFRLLCTDYTAAVLGPPLSRYLAAHAPNVHLRLETADSPVINADSERLRSLDAAVLTNAVSLPHTESLDLLHDNWVCVVSGSNRRVGPRLTANDLRQLPWVMAHDRVSAASPAPRQLTRFNVDPHVVMVVDSFLSLPSLVVGTDRIAMLPRRLADQVIAGTGVRVMALPGPVEQITLRLVWHSIYDAEAAHQWLRAALQEVARQMTTTAASTG